MTLRIDEAQVARMHAHAEAGFPHEVVGILAGSRDAQHVTHVEPLHNERSDSAHNRYKVGPLVLQKACDALEARGLDIVGYYHSHPDHPARYSDYDRDHAWPFMSYVIVSVMAGRVADTLSWRLTDDRDAMDPEPIEVVTTSSPAED